MGNKREVNLAVQAALVPLFGGLDKKPRPLDRDVVIVGRARGCDIGLEAPEVSTIHCLIHHGPDGFRVRDCGSRTGTRVNGGPLRGTVLKDGDVLQIGPFSFAVRIPASFCPDHKKLEVQKLEHWEHSRRNLVRLALKLRRKMQQGINADALQAELNHKAADLRNRIRQYDQRLNQLEEAERDLNQDREQLKRERDAYQGRVQQLEGDIAARLEMTDQEIHARWQEFQNRCQHEEARMVHKAKETCLAENKALEDQKLQWEKRLSWLQKAEQDVEDAKRERQETQTMKVQWTAEQAEAREFLEKQRQALGQAEAALGQQRDELGRMMADLRDLQAAIKKQQSTDDQALTRENQALTKENQDIRQVLAENERRLAESEQRQPEQELRLAEYELRLAASAGPLAPTVAAVELEKLKGEIDLLRKSLQEKERLIKELKQRPPGNQPTAESIDLESFEAELNQYRQHLEADRAKLHAEIEQVRQRNNDLDEATREMEMEMSKERAELARERTRLDRLREEVRNELERIQRDAGMRESLAPVQKLREEMNQKKGNGPNLSADHLNDRLRNFRNRLTDTPS